MLQIKNTLGGGKPEGMYVWKKNEIELGDLQNFNKSLSTLSYYFERGSAVVLNNEIHILGSGYDSLYYKYHYKWDGSSWTKVSTLPYSFYQGSAVALNGEIHILGGIESTTKHYKWDGTSWTEVSTLPFSFHSSNAVVLNGEIHILGSGSSSYYTEHYKWDGSNWIEVSTLPYAFKSGSAVVLNGEIHIFGSSDSSYYTAHYKWDGTSWTSVSTLPYNFYEGSAVLFYDRIHILGGTDNGTGHYKWDGSSWTSVNTLPYSFYRGSAVVYNNTIQILGGYYSSGTYSKYHYSIVGYTPTYTFLDYIVSDKENAYPDGGEKGGYWYEKVKDIDLLTAGGYTKIAVDKFTFSSATSLTNKISHSLGEIPLFYLIVADIPSASKNDFLGAFYFKPKFQSTKADGVYYYARGDNTYSAPSVGELKTLTDNSISIFNNTTYKYKAGVEYTLITMA